MRAFLLGLVAVLTLAAPAWATDLDTAPTIAPSALVQGTTVAPKPRVAHPGPVVKPHPKTRTRHPVHVAPKQPGGYTTGPAGGHHYTNVDGVSVHSPVRAKSAPAGACAECNDGTYSFSQHHRGTCSHHGGVKVWL